MYGLSLPFRIISLGVCLLLLSTLAFAKQGDEQLDTLTVYGKEQGGIAVENVPGGTNLIDLDAHTNRAATLKDALEFEPGVIIQSFFGGNDQPRLNIRGSGIQSNPVNRGIQLLYDGLPLNQSDGSFVIGLLDPKTVSSMAVYRGANGMWKGSTTLGGAIDMQSRTGRNSRSTASVEYGSYGRAGALVQLANSQDQWDYFVSYSRDQYDGYRHHSDSKRDNVSANLGYVFNDAVENRTYLTYTSNFFNIPFVVPKTRALSEPQQVLGDQNTALDKMLNVYKRKPHRDSELLRIADTISLKTEHSHHQLGAYYQRLQDTFTNQLSHTVTDSDDYGLQYSVTTDFSSNQFGLNLAYNASKMSRDYFANNPANGQQMQRFGEFELTPANTLLYGYWQADITSDWQLLAGLQWAHNQRDIQDNINHQEQQKTYQGFNPSIGLNYKPTPDIRLFANLSQTFEAPTYWELISANVKIPKPAQASVKLYDLHKQKAKTLEIGTKGDWQKVSWDVTAYRSEIDDELISVASDFAVNWMVANYQGGTVHQGLELGSKLQLAQSVFNGLDQLGLDLVYNYSDFKFDSGQYQGNQLAGIPKHLIHAQLVYQSHNQLVIAPNVYWHPQDTAADHANTQFQDSFYLLGLNASYQFNDALRLYLKAENLADKVYQSSYVIRGLSKPTQPTFLPGTGRSVSVGVNIQW